MLPVLLLNFYLKLLNSTLESQKKSKQPAKLLELFLLQELRLLLPELLNLQMVKVQKHLLKEAKRLQLGNLLQERLLLQLTKLHPQPEKHLHQQPLVRLHLHPHQLERLLHLQLSRLAKHLLHPLLVKPHPHPQLVRFLLQPHQNHQLSLLHLLQNRPQRNDSMLYKSIQYTITSIIMQILIVFFDNISCIIIRVLFSKKKR